MGGLAELATAEQMTFLSVKWDFYGGLLLQVLGGFNKVQALSPVPLPLLSHWFKPRKLESLSSGTQEQLTPGLGVLRIVL